MRLERVGHVDDDRAAAVEERFRLLSGYPVSVFVETPRAELPALHHAVLALDLKHFST